MIWNYDTQHYLNSQNSLLEEFVRHDVMSLVLIRDIHLSIAAPPIVTGLPCAPYSRPTRQLGGGLHVNLGKETEQPGAYVDVRSPTLQGFSLM